MKGKFDQNGEIHANVQTAYHFDTPKISFSSLLYESPWFFMCATLLPYDVSDNAPFQLETTMRSTTGCMVSSLNHLKDMQDENGAFFVFPDISIRVDGQYRFRMTLFEIAG
jgi:hypothetical protein